MNETAIRVLLADPRPGAARDLAAMLPGGSSQPFSVTAVASPDEARARLQQQRFDVLVLAAPLVREPLPDASGDHGPVPVVLLAGPGETDADVLHQDERDRLVQGRTAPREAGRILRHAVERARAKHALWHSEQRFRSLFRGMTEGFVLHEIVRDARGKPCDCRLLDVNPAFERLTGLRRDRIVGRRLSEVLPDNNPRFLAAWSNVARTGLPVEFEDYSPALRRHYQVFAYRPAPEQVAVLFTDVTERVGREAELNRLNRTLKALSENSQAIMRAHDESQYLREVCRIIVEHCGHRMVWIGLAEDDDARSVRPVAHAGFEAGYIESLKLTWADTERGRGPTGTAIRTGRPAGCRNMVEDPDFMPWRAEALRRGYASSLSVPLLQAGRAFGAITLYSREVDGFSGDSVQLLVELADDASHGLAAIRTRAAHAAAEAALRRERDFVSAILDTAGAVVVVLDRRGCIMRFNRAAEQLTGYDAPEVLGRALWDLLIPPDDLRPVKRAWANLGGGDFPRTLEHHWRTKDGRRRLLAWSNTVLTDADGRIQNVIATGIDITETRQAEREIREREEELTAIYENAPLLMLLVDGERRIRKANKQAEQFARASATDLLGQRAGEALRCTHAREAPGGCGSGPHCRHCDLRRAVLNTVRTGRSCRQLEVTLPLAADGGSQDVTFIVSTRRLEVRGQNLALVTLQDITSRKQAEEAVQRARSELELRVVERTAQLRHLATQLTRSEEAERRRIARILHDQLQQLLGAARLRLETLRRRKDPFNREDDLRRIERLIEESNQVARNLSHELSPAVLHEYGLVAGLRWLGRWMRDKHDLTVRVHEGLPAGALADDLKVLLFQSVRELLFNVVKHAGVKRAAVRVSRRKDGWLQVTVSDRGRGFRPSPASVSPKAGPGLGLFSVRERITYLGGRMEIGSRPGAGCRTSLIVPLPEIPDRAGPPGAVRRRSGRKPRAASRRDARTTAHRPGLRVLLADDHKIMRDGLAAYLGRRPGIEIVGLAADGREAVGLAGRLQPHVVIMDVSMPRLNGIEATRRIVAQWPQITVIGLTMHTDAASHEAMRAAGAVACFVKSSQSEELVRAIRAALPGRSARRRLPSHPVP